MCIRDRILPRTVTAQAQVGSEISWDVMRPGDILFFYTDQPGVPQFCGILESDGVMIYSLSLIHISSSRR